MTDNTYERNMYYRLLINFIVVLTFTTSQIVFAENIYHELESKNLKKNSFSSNDQTLDKMGKLYDPNCHEYVTSKDYVRIGKRKIAGKTEKQLYNDLDQRTERYFNWGTYAGSKPKGLTHDYLELIKSVDVKKAADKRYSEWDPVRPPPDLTYCDANPNMNSCLAFQVYCTEQIVSRAMNENLEEYADQVKYCKGYYYNGENEKLLNYAKERQEKHPDHCKDDLVKRGSWLNEHAQQVIQVAGELKQADPAVNMYFNEASDTFGKYIGDAKGLKEAQKEAIALKEKQDQYQKELKETKQAIKNCQDVVALDDNDVKGHDVTGYIMNGMQCSASDSLVTLDKNELEKLSTDISNISIVTAADEVDDSVNKAALKKTAMAIWASFEAFGDKNNTKDLRVDKEYAIDELVCNYGNNNRELNPLAKQSEVDTYNSNRRESVAKMGGWLMPEPTLLSEYQKIKDKQDAGLPKICKENRKIVEEAHAEFVALTQVKPIKYKNDDEILGILRGEFTEKIDAIDADCKKIKEEHDEVEALQGKRWDAAEGKIIGLDSKNESQPKMDTVYFKTSDSTTQALLIPKFETYSDGHMPNQDPYWSPWDNGEGPIAPQELVNISYNEYVDKKHYRAKSSGSFANNYSALIQSQLGNLLITDIFQKAVGTKSYEDVYESCRKGGTSGFKVPSVVDVNKAKKELLKLQRDELKEIGKQLTSPEDRIENIQKYLKNNPLTIAKMLEDNPSPDYAKALCAFIRDINADDTFWHYTKLIAAPVGLVAGVTLAATGIGAPAGAGLLGWVAGGTLIAATSFEVAALNRDINLANQNITATQQASATFQQETEIAIKKIKDQKEIKADAEFWLPLTVIFAAVDIVPVGAVRLFKIFGTTNKGKSLLKFYKISSAKKLVEGSEELAKLQKGMERGSKLFAEAAEKYKLKPDNFKYLDADEQNFLMGFIGKMDDVSADQFVKRLNDLENPGQVRKFIDTLATDTKWFQGTSSWTGIEKVNFKNIDWAINNSKKFKLPNGAQADEFFKETKVASVEINDSKKILEISNEPIEIINKTDKVIDQAEVNSNLKIIRENKTEWTGGFKGSVQNGEKASSFPSYSHVIRGNYRMTPNGPVLVSGMHTEDGLKVLLNGNPKIAEKMLDESGHIKATHYMEFENGVRRVRIPNNNWAGEIVGNKASGKTLFPKSWDSDKILDAINTVKKEKPVYESLQDGNFYVFIGKVDDVDIKVILNQDGTIKSAHPIVDASKGVSKTSPDVYVKAASNSDINKVAVQVSEMKSLDKYSVLEKSNISQIINGDNEFHSYYQLMNKTEKEMLDEIIGDLKYDKKMKNSEIYKYLREKMNCKL